ncbi:MAG: CobD/CbiB family protein, partial [Janthinobacterium lividum]
TNEGTLLAVGSGALGARLIGPLAAPATLDTLAAAHAENGAAAAPVGEDCTPRMLQSAVGLGWRAMILWMILLLMVTLSVWIA